MGEGVTWIFCSTCVRVQKKQCELREGVLRVCVCGDFNASVCDAASPSSQRNRQSRGQCEASEPRVANGQRGVVVVG